MSFDRIIKLCSGPGNGIDAACLMTASNMLIGEGHNGDRSTCQCEVIRKFVISTNDCMPGALRSELYGPLVYEIIGTLTNDIAILEKRAQAFVDWAVREVLPIGLGSVNLSEQAKQLRDLPQICDRNSVSLALHTLNKLQETMHSIEMGVHIDADPGKSSLVHQSVGRAIRACVELKEQHTRTLKGIYRADMINATHDGAYSAMYVVNYFNHAETIWRMFPEIIRKVAAIGDKRPVETVMTIDELSDALN